MDIGQDGNTLQRLQQKVLEQEQRLLEQQGQIAYLHSVSPARQKLGGGLDLAQNVRESFAPHLQLKPVEQAARKLVVKRYPKPSDFPKPIEDHNGLGARAINNKEDKKWLLTYLPKFQRDALDVLRMATAAWQTALGAQSAEQQAQQLLTAIKDIACIAGDNAQRLAQTQLKQTFEASGARGAYTIMDLSADSAEVDYADHSLFQQAHIEALQDLKKFNSSIDSAKKNEQPKQHEKPKYNHQHHNRYGGGRGHGGRFGQGNGRFGNRPNFNNGGGNYQGGGRGRGHNNGNNNNSNDRD